MIHTKKKGTCGRAFWSSAVLQTSFLVVCHFADEHFGCPPFCGRAFWLSAVLRTSILVVRRFADEHFGRLPF
jgi:hypothetical protein